MTDETKTEEVLKPLPVLGYTDQKRSAMDLVNRNKVIEEQVLRIFDDLSYNPEVDTRWLAIARTHLEQSFMCANRAIFKPVRIS